ncbi:MAG: hypothetical protein ACTSU5_20680 [Promethearchaeota archaeon]
MAVTTKCKITLSLLMGMLSMFYAEVFAGSFPLWFLDWWGIFVTFPLYMLHALFFLNLAFRTRRTRLFQLYMFGVFFGLYESWITKVTFIGYPGESGPILGLVAGIAIWEFFSVVFFWHPVMSFILPVLVFEIFSRGCQAPGSEAGGGDEPQNFLPGYRVVLSKTGRSKGFVAIMYVAGGSFLATSSGLDLSVALVTAGGSVFLLWLVLAVARKQAPDGFSIYDLRLGKGGFSLVTVALLAMYLILYFTIAPEVVTLLPALVIVAFYALNGALVGASRPLGEIPPHGPGLGGAGAGGSPFTPRDFWTWLALYFASLALFCFLGPVTPIVGTLFMGGIFVVGPLLYLVTAVKCARDAFTGTRQAI